MKSLYHFQIRKDGDRSQWDAVKAHPKFLDNWQIAVSLAKKAARRYGAEVRLTEGSNPQRANGHYFHFITEY